MLWCDAEVSDDKRSDGRHKKREGGTSSKLDEDDIDEHYKTLTEKHGDSFRVPVMGANTALWDLCSYSIAYVRKKKKKRLFG